MKYSSSLALLSCDFIKQIYSYLQLEYHYSLASKSFTIMLNRTISGSKTENSIIYNSVQKKKSLYYYYFLFLVLKVITQSSHNVPLPFNQTLIGLFSKIFRKCKWLTFTCFPIPILLTSSKVTPKLSVDSSLMLLSQPKNVNSKCSMICLIRESTSLRMH